MKIRFFILIITILVSIAFYYLIEPIVEYCLDFTNVKGAIKSIFYSLQLVFKVLGLFIVILNGLVISFMLYFRQKGKVEYYNGFLYSFVYTLVLFFAYAFIWFVKL
jgi:hypothetical protein